MSTFLSITHVGDSLMAIADLFKVDPKFLENEERYSEIKREILGDSDDESGSESGSDVSDSEPEDEDDGVAPEKAGGDHLD